VSRENVIPHHFMYVALVNGPYLAAGWSYSCIGRKYTAYFAARDPDVGERITLNVFLSTRNFDLRIGDKWKTRQQSKTIITPIHNKGLMCVQRIYLLLIKHESSQHFKGDSLSLCIVCMHYIPLYIQKWFDNCPADTVIEISSYHCGIGNRIFIEKSWKHFHNVFSCSATMNQQKN
jgi:hypothetical protein